MDQLSQNAINTEPTSPDKRSQVDDRMSKYINAQIKVATVVNNQQDQAAKSRESCDLRKYLHKKSYSVANDALQTSDPFQILTFYNDPTSSQQQEKPADIQIGREG